MCLKDFRLQIYEGAKLLGKDISHPDTDGRANVYGSGVVPCPVPVGHQAINPARFRFNQALFHCPPFVQR